MPNSSPLIPGILSLETSAAHKMHGLVSSDLNPAVYRIDLPEICCLLRERATLYRRPCGLDGGVSTLDRPSKIFEFGDLAGT